MLSFLKSACVTTSHSPLDTPQVTLSQNDGFLLMLKEKILYMRLEADSQFLVGTPHRDYEDVHM